jgi:uncharacterized membrane protein (Fun14 family)
MFIFSIVIAELLVVALIYCGILQINSEKLNALIEELQIELGKVETRVESKLGAFERTLTRQFEPGTAAKPKDAPKPPSDYPRAG